MMWLITFDYFTLKNKQTFECKYQTKAFFSESNAPEFKQLVSPLTNFLVLLFKSFFISHKVQHSTYKNQ